MRRLSKALHNRRGTGRRLCSSVPHAVPPVDCAGPESCGRRAPEGGTGKRLGHEGT